MKTNVLNALSQQPIFDTYEPVSEHHHCENYECTFNIPLLIELASEDKSIFGSKAKQIVHKKDESN